MVESQVHEELGWVFREIAKDDLGLDGYVEIVGRNRKSEGRTFAVQIKCGLSFFKEENSQGFVFRGALSHLNYWLSHSLNVVLIICHPASLICYWVPISPEHVKRHKKGWSILVPKSNTLTSDRKQAIERVTQSPQGADVIPLALYRLICEKFAGMQIHNALQTPHDFLYFDEMASRNQELFLIKYIYKPTRKFEVADVGEVIKGRRECGAACGWSDDDRSKRILLFFVAHTISELALDEAIIRCLHDRADIDFYRIMCNLDYGVSLNEVDESGGLVQLYGLSTGEPETFGWEAK